MKNLILIIFFCVCAAGVQSQALINVADPDSLRAVVNQNGGIKTIYVKDLHKKVVPISRKIKINGVEYDLSQNREWVVAGGGGVGDVTQAALDDTALGIRSVIPVVIDPSFAAVTYSSSPTFIYDQLRPDKGVILTGNIAITNSGTVNGDAGSYLFIQDATGGRTVTINGTAIIINTSPNSKTWVGWKYDGSEYLFQTNTLSPPRMTKAQRDALVSPADGLIIYQTDNTAGLRFRENGAWVKPTTVADP